jgi:transcription regulator MmyB-like protein
VLAGVSVDYYTRLERGIANGVSESVYALYSKLFTGPAQPASTARFVFLDPGATGFFVDWDRVASEVVATLRSQAGRDPYDRGLSDLVGEL